MKTENNYCEECSEVTKQISLGFVPIKLVNPNAGDEWFNANYCFSCESLIAVEVTESDLALAEERYLHALVEHGVISKEDARDTLGLN